MEQEDKRFVKFLFGGRYTPSDDAIIGTNLTDGELRSFKDLFDANERGRKAHWAKTNSIGSSILGQSLPTAMHQLTRQKLFELIESSGLNNCFRCNKPMTAQDFTLDHKEGWMHATDPPKSFWAKENHSWSHFTCNCIHTFGHPTKYVKKEIVKGEPSEKKETKAFRIPISLDDSIRDTATSLGLTKSDIVVKAVTEWLNNHQPDPPRERQPKP